MEKIESLNKFLKQISKARKELKYNRKEFWSKNRVNFRNNIKSITSVFTFPEGWNVSIIASRFLLDRRSLPYDKDVWSFSDVVGATKNQGFDIVIFFNKTDLEFLSAPALLPIVIHEIAHIFQAAENPEEYVKAGVDDELNKKYESDADAEARKYSDEFRKENILEKILFCFDEESWQGAKKMTDYLFKEAANDFGGGYDQGMTEQEYNKYLEAEEEKDIDVFIDYFIETLKEEDEKGES
ncbi:MAG: hypothetical protein NTZ83_01300 [Candidatus Pacearchaeota archaeon]|nr:hypothetical protein [Candidatus Pacearchaeota archaeon]